MTEDRTTNRTERGWTYVKEGDWIRRYSNRIKVSAIFIYRHRTLRGHKYYVGCFAGRRDGPFDDFGTAEGHWLMLQETQ